MLKSFCIRVEKLPFPKGLVINMCALPPEAFLSGTCDIDSFSKASASAAGLRVKSTPELSAKYSRRLDMAS